MKLDINIESYARTHGITLFEAFSRAWGHTYGRPCASNQVILDLKAFQSVRRIPPYVGTFVRYQNQKAHDAEHTKLVERATKHHYHGGL